MAFKIRTINRDISTIRKNQMKILLLKSTITEMKNLLDSFNSKFNMAEDRISEK